MLILTLGSKKEEKENFQSKEKRRKISNQRESKKRREGKFPIKEKRKQGNSQSKSGRKKKEKKENSQSKNGKKKREEEEGKKAPDQGSKETRRNVQRGLWTGQYLNNTELSPNEQKEGKETTT